jgi:hypothetical protein
MDLNLIKNKLASLQQKQGGGKKDFSTIIWKPAIGKHSVRMVPSAYNKSWPFKEVFFHYGIGSRTMISLVNFEEKDPIVEFATQISKSNDKENWQLAKKLQPKMRVRSCCSSRRRRQRCSLMGVRKGGIHGTSSYSRRRRCR